MPGRVSNYAEHCEGQRCRLTSQLIIHTRTHAHSTAQKIPRGGADSGSIKTGKWPNNKDAQLDEVRRMGLLPEDLPV